jgi:FAD:protein FMN transferase
MKQTKLLMGMPVTVEIIGDTTAVNGAIADCFDYFKAVDRRFSTYKPNSEISRLNRGLPRAEWSVEMREVLQLCEQTKQATAGYFDIRHAGQLDPSGLVKGWAIRNAARQLADLGLGNFYIDAGGDIQVSGNSAEGRPWRVGIRNPFDRREIIKRLSVSTQGVATSGTYIRGQHVYNPLHPEEILDDIVSLTVVGPNIYEADRFATAAFAMGRQGAAFIETMPGLEAYQIDRDGLATYTSKFERFVI